MNVFEVSDKKPNKELLEPLKLTFFQNQLVAQSFGIVAYKKKLI